MVYGEPSRRSLLSSAARLLPVPAARAGDMTAYSFDYFANTTVLPSVGAGAAGILARGQ